MKSKTTHPTSYALKIWPSAIPNARYQVTKSNGSQYLNNSQWFGSMDEVGQYLKGVDVSEVRVEKSLPRHLKQELDRYGIKQAISA